MTVLPLDPSDVGRPDALLGFLRECQEAARRHGGPRLVSISLEVDALDPLAVLESIFEANERHFYVERPGEGVALAGAEAVAAFSAEGVDRFARCQTWIDALLEGAVAIGDVDAPFGGPHFFAAFTFDEGTPEFPPASVFVPRWQVGTRAGRTVAVANVLIAADTPVDAQAGRILRAHGKFRSFDYGELSASAPGERRRGRRLHGGTDRLSERTYREAVAQALAEIGRGEYRKIVLARARELVAEEGEGLHPLRVLNGMRQRFADCHAFSIANGAGQSFIGASPERLVEVRAGRLRTEALAGSARRGAGASEDAAMAASLLRDDKELREHAVVLDTILSALRDLGLSPKASPRPTLRRFANVQHLHTPVEAALAGGVRLLDVLARLHPTPAVGGFPREAALARIRPLEGFPRGLYAGALGWIDARGDGDFFVGLRSALIDGSRATLYAGAGIVAGSDPARELAETELKFSAMQEALLAAG